MEGTGHDEVGEFRWVSNQRKALREAIRFTKVYQTHEVDYHGRMRGGLISGTWSIHETTGQFCLWPKDYEKYLKKDLWKITAPPPGSHTNDVRNQDEGKLEFIEIANLEEDDDDVYDERSDDDEMSDDDSSFISADSECYHTVDEEPMDALPDDSGFYTEGNGRCVRVIGARNQVVHLPMGSLVELTHFAYFSSIQARLDI